MALQSAELSRKGVRATLVGIFFSFLLVIIKGTAGILGNSYALVADAIESSTDIFTSLIVLLGLKIASKPADSNHPYGHGKAEPIAGAVVAIGLLIAAAVIIFQSIHEIITPHHAPAPFTLWVLAAVIVIKEGLFRFVFKVGLNVQSIAVKNDAWHHRSDALTSAAAFIGISVALIGGEGYQQADDWAALVASGIIILNAYLLFKPALYEIMDTAPPPEITEAVIQTAKDTEGVLYIDKCYIRKMGFDYFVDIHIIVNGSISVHDGHLIAHKVKDNILFGHKKVSDVLVHVEPNYLNSKSY